MEEIPNGIKLGEQAGLWLWAMDLAHPFEDSEGKTSMAAIGQGCPVQMNIIMALKNRENFTKCESFWAFVVPAFFDFNLIKMDNNEADEIITKFVVRIGYIIDLDGISADIRKQFEDYAKGISKMAIALVLSIGSEESKEWLEMGNVEEKLPNLPFGEYFYTELSYKTYKEGSMVKMMMHQCSGRAGTFVSVIRAQNNEKSTDEEFEFDWHDDFDFLQNCKHELVDLSSNLTKDLISRSLGSPSPTHIVDFPVGIFPKKDLHFKLNKEQKIAIKFYHEVIQKKEYYGQTIVDDEKIFNGNWNFKLIANFLEDTNKIMKKLGMSAEDFNEWTTRVGEYGVFQEKYECPSFTVYLPQVSGRIKFAYSDLQGNVHLGYHGYSSKNPEINFIDSYEVQTAPFGQSKCKFEDVYLHKEKNIFQMDKDGKKCQL